MNMTVGFYTVLLAITKIFMRIIAFFILWITNATNTNFDTDVHMDVYRYVHVCVCVCMYVCKCVWICEYIYIYTHTNIQVYLLRLNTNLFKVIFTKIVNSARSLGNFVAKSIKPTRNEEFLTHLTTFKEEMYSALYKDSVRTAL